MMFLLPESNQSIFSAKNKEYPFRAKPFLYPSNSFVNTVNLRSMSLVEIVALQMQN
jgi:hypothetical protein